MTIIRSLTDQDREESTLSFTITPAAVAELSRFSQEELYEGEWIRIGRSYQCGGPKFQLTVEQTRTNMDDTILVDGVQVIVERACLQLLEACELDFHDGSFVFIDPHGNPC